MIHQTILDRGVTLLAIAPSRPEFSRQVTKKHNLSIPILTDQDNTLASKFGLVFTLPEELREIYLAFGIDLERHNGNSSWTLPMPARYIVSQNGLIHDADVNLDYTTRPEPDDLLKKLEEMMA